MSQDLIDDKSTLVQVMAVCRKATSNDRWGYKFRIIICEFLENCQRIFNLYNGLDPKMENHSLN